eukprot:6798450-Pyramimonas_sp.AAC.1
MQRAKASAAGVTGEAQRRLAQEENDMLRAQSTAEQFVLDSQQKAEGEKADYREMADAARREGETEAREQAARENQELRNQLAVARPEAESVKIGCPASPSRTRAKGP